MLIADLNNNLIEEIDAAICHDVALMSSLNGEEMALKNPHSTFNGRNLTIADDKGNCKIYGGDLTISISDSSILIYNRDKSISDFIVGVREASSIEVDRPALMEPVFQAELDSVVIPVLTSLPVVGNIEQFIEALHRVRGFKEYIRIKTEDFDFLLTTKNAGRHNTYELIEESSEIEIKSDSLQRLMDDLVKQVDYYFNNSENITYTEVDSWSD